MAAFELLFLTLPVGFLYALPLARTLLRGIASARDDLHRTVPVSPWHFFDHACKRRLRRLLFIWLAVIALVLVLLLPVAARAGIALIAIYPAAILLSMLATVFNFSVAYAPRFQQPAALAAVSTLAGILSLFLLSMGLMMMMFLIVSFRNITAISSVPFLMLAVTLLAATLTWVRIRRGTKWFRIKE